MKLFILRKTRWPLKLFILVPMVVVVLLNVHLINRQEIALEVYANQNVKYSQQIILNSIKNVSTTLLLQNLNLSMSKNQTLKRFIFRNNLNPIIRNKHFIESLLNDELVAASTITPTTSSTTTSKQKKNNKKEAPVNKVYKPPKFLVILIQVHSRLNYLKELIESLRNTAHIKDTLVVFSHDIFDTDMNDLIKSIDFCAVS